MQDVCANKKLSTRDGSCPDFNPTVISLLGWMMPPVPMFNLTDEELEQELRMSGSH
jgi:hypothetical protein